MLQIIKRLFSKRKKLDFEGWLIKENIVKISDNNYEQFINGQLYTFTISQLCELYTNYYLNLD